MTFFVFLVVLVIMFSSVFVNPQININKHPETPREKGGVTKAHFVLLYVLILLCTTYII